MYTDGSSTGRVGPGGWAWVTTEGHCASGSAHGTTNQRMELQAALEAIQALPGLLLVVSDSEYVVKGATEWWPNWARVKYRRVANADLWEQIVTEIELRAGEVRFAWVKGHAGYEHNEYADQLAKAARHELTTCPSCGDQMTSGGIAIVCSRAGASRVALPYRCLNADCRADREARAMADAVAVGVIDA
ncbi:ribonuclease H family protein [Nocardioides marmoraquaticus]